MKRLLLNFLGLLTFLGLPLAGLSQPTCVYTSTASGGLFTSPSTWTVTGGNGCGPTPSAQSTIIVNGPVVLNTNFSLQAAGRLTINSGGSLIEDGTRRTLTLGAGSAAQAPFRALVSANARLTVSELQVTKSTLTVAAGGTTTAQCNLTLGNLGDINTAGAVVINGNLRLTTGNALLQGPGTLLIRGCVVGTNGALQNAIQGSLLVCVRNQPTVCGTGVCNGDVPINNDANCVLVDPPPPALPVELMAFTANANGRSVRLAWKTASEQNSKTFVIERSATGREFGAIGQIQAAGTSVVARDYTWQDARPLSGQGYYRLRQIDDNATATFSDVVSVRAVITPTALTIWPAAAAGRYEVSAPGEEATLTVLTPQGSTVSTQTLAATGGQFNLSDCPAGLYLIRTVSTQGVVITRIGYPGQ